MCQRRPQRLDEDGVHFGCVERARRRAWQQPRADEHLIEAQRGVASADGWCFAWTARVQTVDQFIDNGISPRTLSSAPFSGFNPLKTYVTLAGDLTFAGRIELGAADLDLPVALVVSDHDACA